MHAVAEGPLPPCTSRHTTLNQTLDAGWRSFKTPLVLLYVYHGSFTCISISKFDISCNWTALLRILVNALSWFWQLPVFVWYQFYGFWSIHVCAIANHDGQVNSIICRTFRTRLTWFDHVFVSRSNRHLAISFQSVFVGKIFAHLINFFSFFPLKYTSFDTWITPNTGRIEYFNSLRINIEKSSFYS